MLKYVWIIDLICFRISRTLHLKNSIHGHGTQFALSCLITSGIKHVIPEKPCETIGHPWVDVPGIPNDSRVPGDGHGQPDAAHLSTVLVRGGVACNPPMAWWVHAISTVGPSPNNTLTVGSAHSQGESTAVRPYMGLGGGSQAL